MSPIGNKTKATEKSTAIIKNGISALLIDPVTDDGLDSNGIELI